MAVPKIVVLGAGFAGLETTKHLAKLLPEANSADIVVVDENNYSLFTPMLTEVAGGEVDADEIVTAIRSLGPRVTFEQGRIGRVDSGSKTVTFTIGDEAMGIPQAERTISADHLVIALGSVNNFHGIPGVSAHSLTVKTLEDAATIRNRAIALLERADEEPDADQRRALLTFVVGGGGFSGVETMAALNSMVRELLPEFSRVTTDDVHTIIAHPGKRLLPELDGGLAAYAQRKLQERGVDVRLNTEVSGAGMDYVELKESAGGRTSRVPSHMFIWTGGVKPSPVISSAGLDLGKHHGIVVDNCCRVKDHPGIWALGDCAEIPKPDHSGTYAPTAQNATREGALVARNIVAAMRGESPQPFVYHPIGELAIVGKRSGVASVYGIHLAGIPAWAMWRAIYLMKLPGVSKRFAVGIDWIVDLVFGRDIVVRGAHGATHDTAPVSPAEERPLENRHEGQKPAPVSRA